MSFDCYTCGVDPEIILCVFVGFLFAVAIILLLCGDRK
jgi:hypothetical protein